MAKVLKRQTRVLREAARRSRNDALAALDNLAAQQLTPDAHCLAALIQGSASRSSSCSSSSSRNISFGCRRAAILEAEQWPGALKSVKPDSFACGILLSSAAKANSFDVIARTLVRMQNEWGISPNEIAYTALAKACGERSDPHGAERWVSRMRSRGLTPTATTYAVMIDVWARAERQSRAVHWLEQARKQEKCELTASHFTPLIHMCGLNGDAIGAEDWYHKLLSANVQPDGVVFSVLANANAKSFNADRARYWLDQAETRKLKLSVQAFISVISACANQGDAAGAVHWFNKLEKVGYRPNLQTFNAVLHAWGSRNDLDMAVQWLGRLEQARLRPDHFTLTAVLDACGDNAAAAELWLSRLISKDGGVRPDTKAFNAALSAFAKRGDPIGAVRLFDRMPSYRVLPDSGTYNIVLHAHSRQEDVAACEAWLQKMREAGIEPERASFGCVQQARAKTISTENEEGCRILYAQDVGVS